jgi:O-antigen ligase
MLGHFKTALIILLFIWISFFAPLVGQNQHKLFLLTLIVLLLSFVLLKRDSYKAIFNKTELPLGIFLLTMFGGLITVQEPAVAWWHFRFFILPIPFLYFFARIAFENKSGLSIIRGLSLLATLICIAGIIEFITKENIIYRDYLPTLYYPFFKGRRMLSLHVHPTPLGTYLVAIFPLACGRFLIEKKRHLKLFAIAYSAIIFTGIILAFSRGVLLGLVAGLFIMVTLLFKRKRMKLFSGLMSLIIIIIGLSTLLFYSGNAACSRFSLQGLSVRYLYTSKIDRFIMMTRLLKEHPFFGAGFGHFRVLFDNYLAHLSCIYDGKVADCMYVTILAETGLVGFTGFLVFILFLFRRIKRRLIIKAAGDDRVLLVTFLAGFVGMLCAFVTYDGLYWFAPTYLFWGYAGILSSLTQNKQVTASEG